jgi:hypothetical protein
MNNDMDDVDSFYQNIDDDFGLVKKESLKEDMGDPPKEKYTSHDDGFSVWSYRTRNTQDFPITLNEAKEDHARNFDAIGGKPISDDDDINLKSDVARWLLEQAIEYDNLKQTLKNLVK